MMPAEATAVAVGLRRADRATATGAWAVALILAIALIALTGYESRDPDSAVYAGIAARLSAEPVRRWIAPDWWGHWGFDGPFREHPVGILVVPALLARLGYPAPQAAYAANAGFQVLSLVLLGALAARVVAAREARALTWMLQLLLIAFVFRIRANQEYAVLAGVLAALYATERSRARLAWAWIAAGALAWVLLVKGVFALMVPALCALWLWCGTCGTRGSASALLRPTSDARAWLALAATLLVFPTITVAYEALYRSVTGESFLAFYAGPRLDAGAVADNVLVRWPVNVAWYAGRLIWYALPWSLFAVAACWTWIRGGPPVSWSGALAFTAMASGLLILAFAAGDRRADRFIFPGYFFFGAAGAIAAIRWSPRLGRLIERLDRPWVPAAVFLALFLIRLGAGAHLPRLVIR